MKTVILFAIMVSAVSAHAQTLKDALYGGKLKTDTGSVIRKGDDLASKIDTSRKKPVEPEKTKTALVARDSSITGLITQADSAANPNAGLKDNNKIWKDYIDEFVTGLKSEVLTSSKIKNGVYSVLIEYEIGLDGQISVINVSSEPGSSFLEEQIKQRLTYSAPQMTPLLGTNGKPRKAIKKQTLTLTK